MNRVIGRVLVVETGAGVPDLVVTVYDVDRDTMPEGASSCGPVASVVAHWDKLRGDRLGSVLTDTNGEFLLEYEEPAQGERGPDLLLFVTAPERAGPDPAPPLLHVSCGVRQSAGCIETYLIRLTAADLERAGVPMRSTMARQPASAAQRRLSGVEQRHATNLQMLEQVRVAWRVDDDDVRISEVYRAGMRDRRGAGEPNRPTDDGFRLALPVEGKPGDRLLGLTIDGPSRTMTIGQGDAPVAFRFAGVVPAESLLPEHRPDGTVGVVLDRVSGTFRVALGSPPAVVRDAERGPGELLTANLKRRRRRKALRSDLGTRPAPTVDGP